MYEIAKDVKAVSGLNTTFVSHQSNLNHEGQRIEDQEELVSVWEKFLSVLKFFHQLNSRHYERNARS